MKQRGLLAMMVSAGSVACSLLVGGEPTPVHCSQEGHKGPPACDLGYSCLSGSCQADSAAGRSMEGEGEGEREAAGAGGQGGSRIAE